ncbi:MAG: hypothetical protein QOC87_21 [Actinomycetota bacterium]|nr:hypothetical protein [Actinomycetota bacterium]
MRAARVAAIVLATAVWMPSALASGAAHNSATVVGRDVAGDWGSNTADPVGDALGEDLTAAAIGMKNPKTVAFTLSVHSLPSVQVPETTYNWHFKIDKTMWELDSSCTSTDACSPGALTFRLVTCSTAALAAGYTRTTCELVQRIAARLDSSAGTITIPVPLASLRAHSGSSIAPAPRAGVSACGQILAYTGDTSPCAPSAPSDGMFVDRAFRIP